MKIKELINLIQKDEDFKIEPYQAIMNVCYEEWRNKNNFDNMLHDIGEIHPFLRIVVMIGNMNYQIYNNGLLGWIGNGYCGNINQEVKDRDIEIFYRLLVDFKENYTGKVDCEDLFTKLIDFVEKVKDSIDTDDYEVDCYSCGGDGIVYEYDSESDEELEFKCSNCNGCGIMEEDGEFTIHGDTDADCFDYVKNIGEDYVFDILAKLTIEFIEDNK